MTKREEEVGETTNPIFYKRFVNDIISKKKKNQPDLLFDNLNIHHSNIKYTIETMPRNFLETKIIYDDNQFQSDFLDIPKLLVLAEILFCPRNETLSKLFIKKIHERTNNSHEIRIKWITKKVKQLFKLKKRNPHPACVIYEGVCVCEQKFIRETGRNVELWWEEHEDISKDSVPAKHLKENWSHNFSRKVLFTVPENKRIPKILTVCEIALKRPSLKKQTESKKLMLFCNGLAWEFYNF